jgi:hypothetical protein
LDTTCANNAKGFVYENKRLKNKMNMNSIKSKLTILSIASLGFTVTTNATTITQDSCRKEKCIKTEKPHSKLQLGGYGEAVMSRMFYSDNWKRYTDASKYKNAPSHGEFDLPHVVLFINYDFGQGWTMGSEIEFEHGGTESAMEIEEEETGEYEKEIERGGEVAFEQFWLQKSFNPALNLRAGHIVVPIGLTNQGHLPTQFFSVLRPEGENTILPCTWHETGISLWGRTKHWRYELQFLPGLDADRFNNKNWIKGGTGSPYEFKIATAYAGALRIDNYSVKGLRMGVSGYIGNSASNSLKHEKYAGIKGTVSIGSFDFEYKDHNWIARGNFDYGHLSNSDEISYQNKNLSAYSPSSRTNIGSDAIATAVEAGYDIFSRIDKLRQKDQKMYVFGRYDYYDSMYKTAGGILDEQCWGRQRIAGGINYYPIKDIVVKAEYSTLIFKKQYNNENTFSIGIAYAGFFTK